ncbi:MAG TPA: alpha/beta hydrolase [Gemmatimonadales bacterium]|nr:alpha/beta hydrolase [Gemmatimonadales bacterium]
MRRSVRAVAMGQWASLLLLQACLSSGGRTQLAAEPWTDSSAHRISFVSVAPDVRLEVLDWGGSGPPLVFLSGLQDVAHGFDDLAPRFIDHHHVLAITRRGYGASSQPDSGYDLAGRVADLRAVLDSLRLPRVALAGHSIAGDELTAFAGAYPDRVTELVYLDAAYDHSSLGELLGLSPAPPTMLAPDSASVGAVQAYLQRSYGMHIPEAQLRAIGRYDAAGRLVANVTPAAIDSLILVGCGNPDYAAVHAPALVIYAVSDSVQQVFPTWPTLDSTERSAALRFTAALQTWEAAQRARVRREMPSAQVLELHGANHYVFDSDSTEVIRSMKAFFGQSRGRD